MAPVQISILACGAIVGLLILLFASWLAMHPRLQTGLCCSWRLQKKLQWLTYLGCFRTQCWRRARCCSLTANMCSFQSRRGWWRSVLLILTLSDSARRESETLGTVTWPSRFPNQRKNTVQAVLDGTSGPNGPGKQPQSPSRVNQQSTYFEIFVQRLQNKFNVTSCPRVRFNKKMDFLNCWPDHVNKKCLLKFQVGKLIHNPQSNTTKRCSTNRETPDWCLLEKGERTLQKSKRVRSGAHRFFF